jgi:hypothetical protein
MCLAVKGVSKQAYTHPGENESNSLYFTKDHQDYIKQPRGDNNMITILATGTVFFSIIWAEKKGYVDAQRVKTIMNIGMGFGIGATLLYFVYFLSHIFLI